MNINKEILTSAAAFSKRLIAIRRDLHQYPELGFQEQRTCRKITQQLRQIGLDQLLAPVAKTGVIGILQGGRQGTKTVALRADIDALPVEETNSVSYRSRVRGVMHACGHDGHVAMVIGAAMILKRLQSHIPGNVKFLFQPAEEGLGGAEAMIQAGAMRDPKVDAIFGMHISVRQDYGVLGISPGPIMAAADRFQLHIIGRGGHAAHPELCVDPLLAAQQIYQGLQSIGRNLKGYDPHVLSVCTLSGGTTFNVIPTTAEMLGTIRTFDQKVRNTIIRRMRQIILGVETGFGVRCEFHLMRGYPVVSNNAALTKLSSRAAAELRIPVKKFELTMGAEDFSTYQKFAPGVYIDLGIRKNADQPPLHSNRFNFDDRILARGAALMARCALLYLEN